jgi:hypothetical protein
MLRAAIDDDSDGDEEKNLLNSVQEVGTQVTPTGDEIRRESLAEVVHLFFIFIAFWKSEAQLGRNELIRLRAAAGEALSDLARAFGISSQRAYQIIHFKNK